MFTAKPISLQVFNNIYYHVNYHSYFFLIPILIVISGKQSELCKRVTDKEADSMKTTHSWRKRELLFSLYCAAFLHYLAPVSTAPSYRKQHTESSLHTLTGKISDEKSSELNKNAQNQQKDKPSVSINKRSIQSSHLANALSSEFQLFNQNECEDDPSLCKDKLQSWDNQEYDTSIFPEAENMFMYKDMEKNGEDINKIPDKYTLSQRTVPSHEFSSDIPGIIILALPKTSTNDKKHEESFEDENQPIRESKKNIFTSRGWGAGGMPFSVLYLHQQQYHKPSRSPIAGAQQLVAPPAPLRGFPSQYRQVAVRNALSSALTAANNMAGGGSSGGGGGASASLPTRRQYSIIPQLYVSYGWGPHGK